MVKSPKPGACDPEFTVGFPKPLSASQVAASNRQVHVLAVIASEDAENEIHKVVTVGGYVVDVVAEAFWTPAGIPALLEYAKTRNSGNSRSF